MISFKHFLLGFLVLYLALSMNNFPFESEVSIPATTDTINERRFDNPTLAYKVLSKLDIYQANYNGTKLNVTTPPMRLINDDEYCNKHRAYFVENPGFLFEESNILVDMAPDALPRRVVVPAVGVDIMPNIGHHMPENETSLFDIDIRTTLYFTRIGLFFSKDMGKQFACLSQATNHIAGNLVISRKSIIAAAANLYVKRYKEKPQCFNETTYFPKTWLLRKQDECKDFFEILNSQEYQQLKAERTIVYIRKIGRLVHMGEGVQPVNEEEEAHLRSLYGNGELCGQVVGDYLVQHYIHNPLLLNGHKFDFRMYLLVASTNPLIAYYHDGFLRVSISPYDVTSDDKKVLLTNLGLSHEITSQASKGILYNGMDSEGIKHAQQWTFERLQDYLLEKGIINDPNWLDNHLRPDFKKAMIHLMRISSRYFQKNSALFELYGVDFMLDTELRLWFIEGNNGPGLDGYSKDVEKIVVKMLKDHFEVVTGLLRSRMKRVMSFVNKIIVSGEAVEVGEDVDIRDLEKRREEFQKITQNYFEEEFKPSQDNGFSLIIDANYKGVKKFQGFISQECR